MIDSQAYCPGALSFIFKVCPHDDPLKMGSIGVGCTINKGVTVKVKKADNGTMLINGQRLNLPTVSCALTKLTSKPVSLEIESELPLGSGFAVSSASTLATLFAVNKLYKLNKSSLQLAQFAHQAEIACKTGLGSVATQTTGGFLVKLVPGLPPKYDRLPFTGKKLYAVIIGSLPTPAILNKTDLLAKINSAAEKTLTKIGPPYSLENLLELAYRFSRESSLLQDFRIKSLIKDIRKRGGHATMAMLGKVVISDIKPSLRHEFYRIEELIITNDTANTQGV